MNLAHKNPAATGIANGDTALHSSKDNAANSHKAQAGPAYPFELVDLCSGQGQLHTDSPSAFNPRPLDSVTWSDVLDMIQHPKAVQKSEGPWAIFSTLKSRVFERQRKEGSFFIAWSDLDENPPGVSPAVLGAAEAIKADTYGYSSRSATQDTPKCRLLFPLAEPIDGQRYEWLQECINDRLEAAGFTPDRVTERAAQLCYLPNRGELYEHDALDILGPLDWKAEFGDELAAKENAHNLEQAALEQARAQWEKNRKHREAQYTGGQISPIATFRDNYSAREAWLVFGCAREHGKRCLSPYSSSGSAAITFTDDGTIWCSHHGSDVQAGIGTPSEGKDSCWGDSFDVFVHFEHKGDFEAALKAAGEMFKTPAGDTITKHNQRTYMQNKAKEEAAQDFSSPAGCGEESGEPFSLAAFTLTGQATEMRHKMLDDKFVLKDLAIMGQMTAFYAKPNAGKTLMTLFLLIDSIKRGEVRAENVFYINADDNYRGLVDKLELAERYGFHMLAPGHNGFESIRFAEYLVMMTQQGIAQDCIIVLDTLKKFADLMDKQAASRFMNHVREFVSHGGTVIMLAHTNKHRDGDGKLVFAGTSDVVDDIDCAYMIDALDDEGGRDHKAVMFENFKSRGDVADTVTYRYSTAKGQGYRALLESVELVSADEARLAAERAVINRKLQEDKDAVEAILEAMGNGREGVPKKALLAAAGEAGISRQRANRVIKERTGTNYLDGHRWRMEKGEKNAQLFFPLYMLDAGYKKAYDAFDGGDDEEVVLL